MTFSSVDVSNATLSVSGIFLVLSLHCGSDATVQYMASLKAFSRLLELDPKSLYGRYQVAAIELLLGLRAKSLTAFEGLLKETPDYVPALKGAGEAQLAIAREQYSHGFGERAILSAERATTLLLSCTKQQGNLRSVWKAYGDALVLRAQLTHLQKGVAAEKVSNLLDPWLQCNS